MSVARRDRTGDRVVAPRQEALSAPLHHVQATGDRRASAHPRVHRREIGAAPFESQNRRPRPPRSSSARPICSPRRAAIGARRGGRPPPPRRTPSRRTARPRRRSCSSIVMSPVRATCANVDSSHSKFNSSCAQRSSAAERTTARARRAQRPLAAALRLAARCAGEREREERVVVNLVENQQEHVRWELIEAARRRVFIHLGARADALHTPSKIAAVSSRGAEIAGRPSLLRR